jgi:hypothetical protein
VLDVLGLFRRLPELAFAVEVHAKEAKVCRVGQLGQNVVQLALVGALDGLHVALAVPELAVAETTLGLGPARASDSRVERE